MVLSLVVGKIGGLARRQGNSVPRDASINVRLVETGIVKSAVGSTRLARGYHSVITPWAKRHVYGNGFRARE